MKLLLFVLLFNCNVSIVLGNKALEIGEELIQISDYDSAVVILNIGINTCDNCSKSEIGYLYLNRGKAFQLSGVFENSITDYATALNYFKSNNDIEGTATAYISLAEFYRYQRNHDKAKVFIQKAIGIHEKSPLSNEKLALLYNRHAAILNESWADKSEVIKYSELAISLSTDPNLKAGSLREMASAYENLDPEKALNCNIEALEIYDSLDNKLYKAEMLFVLGRHFHIVGEYDKSIKYCSEGLIITKANNWIRVSRDLLGFIYSSYEKKGDYKSAYLTHIEHTNYIELVYQQQWDQDLRTVEANNSIKVKDYEIEIEKRKSDKLVSDSKTKEQELRYIILFSILLFITLSIAIYAYFKIKRKNKIIHKSLKQKEILIQEVHHRVKNNLTFLNSLLYLRSKASNNTQVIDVLQECQSRVQAMSIVHQNLYNVEDSKEVEFNMFVQQLTDETMALFNQTRHSIDIKTNTNNISFEMGFCVFLGLILNELITNSIKHAFKDKLKNSISIDLEETNGLYTLTYFDSGIGLPTEFKLDSSGGFGFKLINLMLDQIDATLEYDESLKKFKLQFKL